MLAAKLLASGWLHRSEILLVRRFGRCPNAEQAVSLSSLTFILFVVIELLLLVCNTKDLLLKASIEEVLVFLLNFLRSVKGRYSSLILFSWIECVSSLMWFLFCGGRSTAKGVVMLLLWWLEVMILLTFILYGTLNCDTPWIRHIRAFYPFKNSVWLTWIDLQIVAMVSLYNLYAICHACKLDALGSSLAQQSNSMMSQYAWIVSVW